MRDNLLSLNLQLFQDGVGGISTGMENATDQTGEVENVLAAARGKKARTTENIVYGIQEENSLQESGTEKEQIANVQDVKDTSDQESFDNLIKGKFKTDFENRVQKIIDKRFKETKKMEAKIEKMQPLIDLLSTKYQLEDVEDIYEAMQGDDSLYESGAIELGLTTEQYKDYLQQTSENKRLRAIIEEQNEKKRFEEQFNAWSQESEKVQALYPNFDFANEIQENEQFRKLLWNGIGVRAAFEACHSEEIIQGAMEYTAQRVAQKTANNIAMRANRPLEGGMGSNASITVRSDVSKLTKADRAEIVRRVARGENIRF